MIAAATVIDLALDQAGDRYRFGAETDPGELDPDVFDCSELVEWLGARLGVSPVVPDGSWLQYRHVHHRRTTVSIPVALKTAGALLFRFAGGNPLRGSRPRSSHVALSLGDGRTMEARSTASGVGVFGSAAGRGWTHAGLIPGVRYPSTEVSPTHANAWEWGVTHRITDGSRPRDVATRQEVMTMLRRVDALGRAG